MSSRRLRAYTLLLITSIIWGIAVVVIKLTLTAIDPLPFLTYRFGISALVAIIFFAFSAKQLRTKIRSNKQILMLISYAILSTTVALGLLFLGLDLTTVLNLSLITLAAPLFAEAAGMLFLKEHLTHREKVGTAIAFLGTGLLIIDPVLQNISETQNLWGNILVITYMVADIAGIILLKKLLRIGYSSATLTNFSFIVGFVSIIPIALIFMPLSDLVTQITELPLIYHAGIWYMAIFSGTIAYYLRGLAQKTIEVSEASLFGYITPVISGILAVMLLGDQLTFLFAVGALIVAIGVGIAEYKAKLV